MTPEQTSNETSTVSYDDALNEYYEEMNRYMSELATELGVSVKCVEDVWYLRTRSRHTPELEAELIALHAVGTPPNMCDFGVSEKTQNFIREACQDM